MTRLAFLSYEADQSDVTRLYTSDIIEVSLAAVGDGCGSDQVASSGQDCQPG